MLILTGLLTLLAVLIAGAVIRMNQKAHEDRERAIYDAKVEAGLAEVHEKYFGAAATAAEPVIRSWSPKIPTPTNTPEAP